MARDFVVTPRNKSDLTGLNITRLWHEKIYSFIVEMALAACEFHIIINILLQVFVRHCDLYGLAPEMQKLTVPTRKRQVKARFHYHGRAAGVSVIRTDNIMVSC